MSVRPPVMFCFLKGNRGRVLTIGVTSPNGSWPPSVDRDLQNSLNLNDCLQDLSKMTEGRFQMFVRSMESSTDLLTDLLTDGAFVEFKTSDFEPYQLLQLLHVQFRLCLGFPALVEEGFNPKLACALAEMLRLEFDGKLKDAKDVRGSLLLTLEQKPSESQEELWERVQSKCRPEDLPKPVKFIELKEPAKRGSVARLAKLLPFPSRNPNGSGVALRASAFLFLWLRSTSLSFTAV